MRTKRKVFNVPPICIKGTLITQQSVPVITNPVMTANPPTLFPPANDFRVDFLPVIASLPAGVPLTVLFPSTWFGSLGQVHNKQQSTITFQSPLTERYGWMSVTVLNVTYPSLTFKIPLYLP